MDDTAPLVILLVFFSSTVFSRIALALRFVFMDRVKR
jgi:hypothetical protein